MSQTILNPDLEQFIEQELSLGRYSSREALLEQALTLLIQRSPSRLSSGELSQTPTSLAGTVLHYNDPFEAVVSPITT
jgi:Arc/MetJ-type ribon-helix-helix transcriptional regulator